MAIHYFGRGINDTEPDRYMPHCDGDCEGDSFRPGTRVATMVMYCSVPEVGELHGVMDEGFSEHSGEIG